MCSCENINCPVRLIFCQQTFPHQRQPSLLFTKMPPWRSTVQSSCEPAPLHHCIPIASLDCNRDVKVNHSTWVIVLKRSLYANRHTDILQITQTDGPLFKHMLSSYLLIKRCGYSWSAALNRLISWRTSDIDPCIRLIFSLISLLLLYK